MSLVAGTRLGPYEILAPLGAGGMGEVYKARDTRLDRTVAIKILPEALAAGPQFRDRFDREARVISKLDHPHICALYDVGEQDGASFLVMQYLEGETLAERLKMGALPFDQALTYVIEIASALDSAHRAAITHRDLKPSNIMLTKSGSKLLDFGLAKVKGPVIAGAGLSMLPTTPPTLTAQGTILGAFQYMAPEQLEGKDADARTDIFAFGAVVYEMLTGKKAFEGKNHASLIAAILEREPAPIASIQPLAPPALDRVVSRCLAKDPDERWQSAHDLGVQLEWLSGPAVESASGSGPASRASESPRSRWWRATALMSLVTLVALAAVLARVYLSPAESASVRFVVLPPEKGRFDSGAGSAAAYNSGSISPDGQKLAFTARDASGRVLLWVRGLDTLDAQALPGTDRASLPFWSPDSHSIGFFADGKLKRVDAKGGPAQTISDAIPRGGTWSQQDVILFSRGPQGPLSRVAATGGEPAQATTLAPQQRAHRLAAFLPDGEQFAYFAIGANEPTGVFITSLNRQETRRLATSDSPAIYSGGYVLFAKQSSLMAQPFSLKTLQFTGQAIPIADSVASIQGLPGFSVSATGTLVYRKGSNAQNLQVAWFDRDGKLIETVGQPGGYISPSLAPDGKRIAVHRHDGTGGDIWLADGQTLSRFTFDPSQDNSNPIWSPDGRLIAFGSLRHGKWGVYQKPSNGTGNEQLLVESDSLLMPMSWSPDGRYLVYYIGDPKTSTDLWALPLTGERKPSPIAQTVFTENHAQISPDGKWIAFNSDETGSNQIYVKPFPSGQGKWQASTTGGTFPRWRRDGKELFYMEAPDAGRMMSVGVKATGDAIEFTQPRPLFDSGHYNMNHPTNFLTYDVSPDGQRFLISRPEGTLTNPIEDTPITVTLNWTAGLRN